MGCPLVMPYRARSSDPLAPLQVTARASCSTAAVRPGADLYCDMSQLSDCAINAGAMLLSRGESTPTATATAAIARMAAMDLPGVIFMTASF